MTTKMAHRSPRMRCHQCGSPELSVVCHHCGRGICKRHSQRAVDAAGMAVSAEFAGLGLEKAVLPFHCDDCAHVVKHRLTRFVVASAVAAFAGVLLMFAVPGLGLLLLLAGAAAGGLCLLVDKKRLDEAARSRPPVPVVPAVNSLSIREKVRGELWLDREGAYRSSVEPVEGKLTAELAVGRPDVERLDRYREKFRLPASEPVRFCAGFVVLEGQVGVLFRDEPAQRTLLDLTDDVTGHPFFVADGNRAPGEWTLELDYGVRADGEVESIPIWLTPSFVPEQDQRALELELQWTEFGPEGCELIVDRVEPLRLLVPISWGNLVSNTREATVGTTTNPDDPDETLRTIEFTSVSVDQHERRDGRVLFSMLFENEIRATDVIRGEFVVSFKGALSGVTDVSFYHPLGDRRRLRDAELTPRTDVEASFRLCLDGIRYQDQRVVPDHNVAADLSRHESVSFENVIPDHETVIDLTNELSTRGYYVKRVIENPPRRGGEANVFNRIWDIAGRRYDGVYPVDFHLVLTGEEFHDGDIRASGGNTTVRITVQGAYTRSVDTMGDHSAGLEEKIVKTWEHLREATVTTLDLRAARAAQAPRHRMAAMRSGGPAMSDTTGPPRRSSESTTTRTSWLRKQLDDATEAVIRGDMTESTFQSIQSSIQRELDKSHEE
jgi:hypothetical protein